MLSYQRYLPAPALRNFIQCYWDIRVGDQPEVLDLVSDGHPELVFLQRPGLSLQVGNRELQPIPMAGLIGQMSERSFTLLQANDRLIYVKLHPWTPFLLFGVPCHHLLDSVADLSELTNRRAYRDLARDLRSTRMMGVIVQCLNRFFLREITRMREHNPYIHYAVQQIFRTTGTLQLDSLTARINASRRYVEKEFKKHIGMTPKQYARLIRVKKASLLLLDQQFNGQVNQVAAVLDYYDQSHFLKDFKAVAGRTPTDFVRQQGNLPLDQKEVYLRQWDYS